MNKLFLAVAALIITSVSVIHAQTYPVQTTNSVTAQTPQKYPVAESPEAKAMRMQWWHEAKFGMFIHWGVYSVPAGYYHDKPVTNAGEWIMNRAKIPVAEYQAFAKELNPVKFDADAWVNIAKDAGMKYIVITA